MFKLKTELLICKYNLYNYFEKGDLRLIKYIIKKN